MTWLSAAHLLFLYFAIRKGEGKKTSTNGGNLVLFLGSGYNVRDLEHQGFFQGVINQKEEIIDLCDRVMSTF